MEILCNTPIISFLKIVKYYFDKGLITDFSDVPRPFYTLCFIEDGEGEFTFENTSFPVNTGDMVFIPMNSTYISKWHNAPTTVCISIHFTFESPSPFPTHYHFPIQKISSNDYNRLNTHFNKMLDCYDENTLIPFSLLGMFYGIMGEIYSKLSFTRKNRLDERIKTAVAYIESHYNEDFSIDFLAELSTMSTSHFHACFKAQVGCSAIAYKHKVCIRNAELLLIENKYSVEQISSLLGFDSSIYFRKVFKKLTGKTPTEYQKSSLYL